MAAGMKLLVTALAALATISLASVAWAQVLYDPMRPPGADGGSADQPEGPVLQSIILSAGRSLAVISGRPYRIGDRLGDARIAAISANTVTLKQAGETKVLTLLPDSVVRSSVGADKRADKRADKKTGSEERR
jgi:MSHA biogenesis protein MshK